MQESKPLFEKLDDDLPAREAERAAGG